jgi:hypothetical protein
MPHNQILPTENNIPENDQAQTENYPITPAHQQAENDIAQDPDLNHHPSPEENLDGGELARLEGQDDEEMDLKAAE